ncbi:hypothetical protein P7K49_011600 [Saguinus oedipus]|uniref:Uncharacterized protein n=1 Tax=Saguinus oedipus TaxID=9490 RepID=A0ABQ9VR47_SAGOE|nr:hypothetical protein P7K49_011600 [Saguinus oedipus]
MAREMLPAGEHHQNAASPLKTCDGERGAGGLCGDGKGVPSNTGPDVLSVSLPLMESDFYRPKGSSQAHFCPWREEFLGVLPGIPALRQLSPPCVFGGGPGLGVLSSSPGDALGSQHCEEPPQEASAPACFEGACGFSRVAMGPARYHHGLDAC